MADKPVKVDPFHYKWIDGVTTAGQIVTMIAGIVMAIMTGDPTWLLTLGAGLGGTKGSLIGQAFRRAATPNVTKMLAIVMIAGGLAGCGGLSEQYLRDSANAMMMTGQNYLAGCKQITVAPAFGIDWQDQIDYSGGLFFGCEDSGEMAYFRCVVTQDAETGKRKTTCEPLSMWLRK